MQGRGRQLTRRGRAAYGRVCDAADEAPIVARVLGAIGVLAVLVARPSPSSLLAMSDLRSSTNEQVQANRVTTAALRLERVVDELDQSLRGFVLTRNQAASAPAGTGRATTSPSATATCDRLVEPAAERGRTLARVIVFVDQLVRDRLRQSAARDRRREPEAALSPTATREGLIRIGNVRRSLARLLSRGGRARLGACVVGAESCEPRRARRRIRARRLGLAAAARHRIPDACGRAAGPLRRERSRRRSPPATSRPASSRAGRRRSGS